jgi:uncharacterized membrane protein
MLYTLLAYGLSLVAAITFTVLASSTGGRNSGFFFAPTASASVIWGSFIGLLLGGGMMILWVTLIFCVVWWFVAFLMATSLPRSIGEPIAACWMHLVAAPGMFALISPLISFSLLGIIVALLSLI